MRASRFSTAQGTSLLSVIVYIIFISGMNYQVANRSFALINQVPDRVTRRFGSSDQVNEHSEVTAAVGVITGGAKQGISTVTQSAQAGMLNAEQSKKHDDIRKKIAASAPTPPPKGGTK